jgi:hypothetical protein
MEPDTCLDLSLFNPLPVLTLTTLRAILILSFFYALTSEETKYLHNILDHTKVMKPVASLCTTTMVTGLIPPFYSSFPCLLCLFKLNRNQMTRFVRVNVLLLQMFNVTWLLSPIYILNYSGVNFFFSNIKRLFEMEVTYWRNEWGGGKKRAPPFGCNDLLNIWKRWWVQSYRDVSNLDRIQLAQMLASRFAVNVLMNFLCHKRQRLYRIVKKELAARR